MIIDFHTHIFPDKIAEHAMRVLSNDTGVPYDAPATAESLLWTMDMCGIDRAVVLNIATKESQHASVLKFAKEVDSERLISFSSVMPESVSALEYVWYVSDEGLKGLKFHPALQRFYPDDEKYFPVYDLARALNLIVVFTRAGIHLTPMSFKPRPNRLSQLLKISPDCALSQLI